MIVNSRHMNFPQAALIKILYMGLLRIREKSSINDCLACHTEADHLHNIPSIVQTQSLDLLRYYFNIERQIYIRALDGDSSDLFSDSWAEINAYLCAVNGGK